MTQLSGMTLVMAVQAVAAEIRRLRAETSDEDAADPRDQLLLEDYLKTARELETAYAAAARLEPDLPPYDELVRN
jgi:hypothetical protein